MLFNCNTKTYSFHSIVSKNEGARNRRYSRIHLCAPIYSTQSSFYTQRIRNGFFFCLNNSNAFFVKNFWCVQYAFMYVDVELFFIILVKSEQWTLDRFYFCIIMIEKWNFNIATCTKHDGSTWYYVKINRSAQQWQNWLAFNKMLPTDQSTESNNVCMHLYLHMRCGSSQIKCFYQRYMSSISRKFYIVILCRLLHSSASNNASHISSNEKWAFVNQICDLIQATFHCHK